MTYSAREAAKMAGTSDTSIHNWKKAGLIPDRREGKITRFTPEDIEKIKELVATREARRKEAKAKKESKAIKRARIVKEPEPQISEWEKFVKKVDQIYKRFA